MKSRRLLLVEDDMMTRRIMSKLLQNEGWEVFEAETLAVARKQLTTRPLPSVVILDLMLPDGLGSELLAEIRTAQLSCRVVIASAVADSTTFSDALKPDAVLCKPIDLPTLLAAISAN